MARLSDERIWSRGAIGPEEHLTKGAVRAVEAVSVRLVIPSPHGPVFGEEVPASLFRLEPRSINDHSFWRMEVAIDPEHQHLITPDHVLVISRYPYGSLWSATARFRRGTPLGETVEVPPSVRTLEQTQRFVDLELERDPWEHGERLVAGIALPLNILGVDSGENRAGGGYAFGAMVAPDELEQQVLAANGSTSLITWTEKATYRSTRPLDELDPEQAEQDILFQAATRLALAGPLDDHGPGGTVADLARSISKELTESYHRDLAELERSLALAHRSHRQFHVDPAATAQARRAAEVDGRLVYKATGPGVLTPETVPMPAEIEDGEILTQLRSLTLCCTDVSNLHGSIGHGHEEAKILGHENCNLVVESRVEGIEAGDMVVPLGDDWLGLAEFEVFRPVLPEHDPATIDLSYESRGGYFDPDGSRHIKAVCVVRQWRSGISLIEPLTHVYTYFATSRDAHLARTVVVLGGGACGLFFCQFVKLFGAATNVVLIDIMDERLTEAKRLGLADTVVNAATEADRLQEMVDSTHGEYADVVFDALPGRLPTDGPPTRRIGMQLLRPRGEYIMYSAAESTVMPAIEMLAKGPRFHFAPYDSRVIDFTQRAQFMRRILAMIDAGQIRPEAFISRQIEFGAADDVQRLFEEYGRTPEVKVEIVAAQWR